MNEANIFPLVSVLMPAYNSEDYIGIAIESVLNSTYQNWELIITDDHSTDNTFNMAKSYAEKDHRIKLILNDRNYGDYPNRNQAASYAKGKYLKYVDHDDYIYPYGLEQLVYYMEKFPNAGYGLCSLKQHNNKFYPFLLGPKETYQMNYFEMELFHKAPLSAIIKKDVFEAVGGFTGKPFLGDFEFWHIISQKHSVVLMPAGIVWYRTHENQESKKIKKNPMNTLKYLTIGKSLIQSANCPLDNIERQKIINDYDKKIAHAIVSSFKHHGRSKALELKQYSKMSFSDIIKYKHFK